MTRKELNHTRLKFKSIERYLILCEWSLAGRSLLISCSERVAEKLKVRLDALVLSFEHLEKITLNDSVVFDVPLPQLPDPSAFGEMKVVKIMRPSKALLKAKFPLIEMKI